MPAGQSTKEKSKKLQLSYRQRKFADCYEGSGVDAAREAGYKGSDNALMVTACRLLRNDKIQVIIKKRQEKEESKRNATRQEKLELLTDMMRDDSALKIEGKDGFSEIIPTIKHADRIKAVELHCKINGDLVQKHELFGKDGGPIETKAQVVLYLPDNERDGGKPTDSN